MEKKYDIFISYSRKDSAIVEQYSEYLNAAGLSVWIDKKGIETGDEFKRNIVRAIKNSDVFLFFSSANSNASPWTVKEVNVAVSYKKRIIPIKLDATPYDESIMFDLAGLDFFNHADKGFEVGIKKLLSVFGKDYRLVLEHIKKKTERKQIEEEKKRQEELLRQQAVIEARRRIEEEKQARIREDECQKALVESCRKEEERIRREKEETDRKEKERKAMLKEKRKASLFRIFKNRYFILLTISVLLFGIYRMFQTYLEMTRISTYGGFHDGIVVAERNHKWGALDADGNIAIPFKYEWLDVLGSSEGLLAARNNGKWGYINHDGDFVIPCEYDGPAYPFKNGISPMKKDGKYGLINNEGEVLVPFIYDYASSSNIYDIPDYVAFEKNNKYGIFDKFGNCITKVSHPLRVV